MPSAKPAVIHPHLRPNKLTPYKAVAGVMAAAQRSGVSNIGVIGNELL